MNIEKGIPIARPQSMISQTLDKMVPGDSILIETRHMHNLRQTAWRKKIKIVTRRENGGFDRFRVWVVSEDYCEESVLK